ncbi:MAG TPA: DUF58 domain-containing protein [Symbiobacteriaceae bacterium]|nr:DUF58 domain-containing protein [Symbiobacteriaceae bacterium]
MERQPSQWLNPTNIGLAVLLGTSVMLRSALLLVLFGFLSVIVILAHWWGRYALDRVEYRRFLERSRCFVGEEMELRIELTNRKILPITYLAVDDTMPLELHIGAKSLAYHRVGKGLLRFLFGLAWYQKVVRRYRLTPTRRGFYRIGPAEMQGGDPLGYVKDSRTVTETNSLIVYPRVVPLDALGLPTRRPFGDLKSKDRLFEDPMRFAGVREYQPGDPLNRIHWKASAAAGELQVRLLDPSSNPGLAVFINTWGWDLFWQGVEPAVLETACVVAASVANYATDQGVPVGMYANGLAQEWGLTLHLPPARGAHVLPQILEGLARLQMPTNLSLAETLANEGPALQYGTSVVIITRQVTEESADALLRVHRSGRPVTLVLIGDPGEVPSLPGIRIYHVTGEEALHAAALA